MERRNWKEIVVQVEEVPPKMYCISSATKNAIMEVSPKIPIYTFLATLAYNGISIIAFLKAPASECIFGDTWLTGIFGGTSSTPLLPQPGQRISEEDCWSMKELVSSWQ